MCLFVKRSDIVSIILVTTKPTIEVCDTVSKASDGITKQSGIKGQNKECQYQEDFYGKCKPVLFQYSLDSSFKANLSHLPTQPGYVESFRFGIFDAVIQIILRPLSGNSRTTNKGAARYESF